MIEDFHPREIWTGVTPPSPTWKLICEKAATSGFGIVPLEAGSRLAFGGAQIDVLAPPPATSLPIRPRTTTRSCCACAMAATRSC